MFRRLLNPGGQLSESKGLLHALTTSLDHGAATTVRSSVTSTSSQWLQSVRSVQSLVREVDNARESAGIGKQDLSRSPGTGRDSQGTQPLSVHFDNESFAPLSDGSSLLRCGNLQILARVDLGPAHKRGTRTPVIRDALSIMFQERASAWWKFPMQNHTRRHVNTDEQGYTTDLIEAAIVPQIPVGFNRLIQVAATLHSADETVDTTAMAINAISAALMHSQIPWAGPVGAVRLAIKGDEHNLSPSMQKLAEADASMLLVGRRNEVVMIDMQGRPVGEDSVKRAISTAHQEAMSLIKAQQALPKKEQSSVSFQLAGADVAARQRVFDTGRRDVEKVLSDTELQPWEVSTKLEEIREGVLESLSRAGFFRFDHMRVAGSGAVSPKDMSFAWEDLVGSCVQDLALQQNLRVGGRGLVDARPKAHSIGLLTSPHGSALSHSGATQVMSSVTVGGSRDLLAPATPDNPRRQLVAYVTDSWKNNADNGFRYKGTTKGERAYGFFVEKSLSSLLPTAPELPFAVRVDMDILSDDGAAADTAFNSAALALQNAKLPLMTPVAAASVALISDAQKASIESSLGGYSEEQADSQQPGMQSWELITDPQELEEMAADMVVWLAGSQKGVNALRLTCTVPGIPLHIVDAAVTRAREAQLDSLASMQINLTRGEHQGPVYGKFRVAKEQVAALIGTGGENVKALESQTGSRTVMRSAEGTMYYVSPDTGRASAAEAMMSRSVGQDMKEGDVYAAKVVSIVDYGAYVALPSGMQALLHISELSHSKVSRVQDVLELGQSVEVKYLGKDRRNFHKISHKACLPLPDSQSPREAEQRSSSPPKADDSNLRRRGHQEQRLQREGRAENNSELFQVGESYTGRIAPSRGPIRGRTNVNIIVRSPSGVSRQLVLAEETQQGVAYEEGSKVNVIYIGRDKCRLQK